MVSVTQRNYSHDSKNCRILNDRSKDNKHEQGKNMIIKEYVKEIESVLIEEKLKNQPVEIFIDSGLKNNYISEKAVKQMKLNIEECRPIKTVFGNREKKECANVVHTELNIKGVNFNITFYVLQETPINYLLGNEFLSKNNAVLDYRNRCLIIIIIKVIYFNYSRKECEEILFQLTKNICVVKGDNDLLNF